MPYTPPFESPLTEEHLAQINNSLEAIDFAKKQIVLAARAGINVDIQKAAADDAEKQLLQIKQVYFPGR